MQIPQTHLQRIKGALHIAQGFLIFIGGCLALAVLTKEGGTSGSTGYFFGLCFLSIPALVYNVMVPMWTRAWRFANVYAYAALDMSFTMFWFAAFVAVAAWNSAGISKGAKDDKDNKDKGGSCSHFAYGSAQKCQVSQASVGFGVLICLLFGVTSAISLMGVFKYRRTGIMPNGNSKVHGQAEQLVEDPQKDVWNANTDELEPAHDQDNPFNDTNDDRLAYGQVAQDDAEQSTGLLGLNRMGSNISHDEAGGSGPHPGRAVSYSSSTELSVAPPQHDEHIASSALSPGGYEDSPGGRVSFPSANYDTTYR